MNQQRLIDVPDRYLVIFEIIVDVTDGTGLKLHRVAGLRIEVHVINSVRLVVVPQENGVIVRRLGKLFLLYYIGIFSS